MFRSIWQIMHSAYTQQRSGIDRANIDHLRADLRFRLAIVEYAYFGRSGRRVARCLEELKAVLGEKAVHRYLRTLDPDLRTQFVERFQGARRNAGPDSRVIFERHAGGPTAAVESAPRVVATAQSASNVVPIYQAARKGGGADAAGAEPRSESGTHPVDSKD